jgi:hypothetical protein
MSDPDPAIVSSLSRVYEASSRGGDGEALVAAGLLE